MHKFLYVGNRAYVLEAMRKSGLDIVGVIAPEASYLAQDSEAQKFTGRKGLLGMIAAHDFDILISNGCPYILPVTDLSAAHAGAAFINIHPSYLPDMKGAHPVTGALLHGRSSGATCHVMSEAVDEGPIIAQTEIPMTDDLEDGYLQALAFAAEVEVFHRALACDFKPLVKQPKTQNHHMHYHRTAEDFMLRPTMATPEILRRVRAFSDRPESAYFQNGDAVIGSRRAEIVTNPYARTLYVDAKTGEVVAAWRHGFCLRCADDVIKFTDISGKVPDMGQIL